MRRQEPKQECNAQIERAIEKKGQLTSMRIAFLPELKQECAKEKGQRISGKKKKQRKHESILQNYENKETGTRTDIKA